MAMAACYPNYDLQQTHHQQVHHQHSVVSSRLVAGQMASAAAAQKDYSVPLHVDCSVEYELPNQAKPPVGARVEPLLMIHPCYFRKMESQRRSPFVNNMPNSSRSSNPIVANVVDSTSMSNRRSSKTSSQQAQQQQQHVVVSNHQGSNMHHHQNLQHQIDEYMQRQMVQRSQQAHYPVGTTANSQQQQQSQLVQSQHHRHHSHQSQPQQLHQQQQSHLTSQQQQSTNQYGMQSQQQQQQQLANTSDWSRYMGPDGVVRSYGKVNLANQTAYSNVGSSQNGNGGGNSSSSNISSKSKAIKRSNTGMSQQLQQNLMPVASCAAFNSSGSSLEGGLPSGPRWDIEKTSMAAVPRDFQAGPESLPIKANASLMASGASNNSSGPQTAISSNHANNYQPSAAMYRNPSVVGKRDAMLSGGCGVYSNSSNNNNNNNIRNNNNTELGLTAAAVAAAGASGLWDSAALLEKSPMAAIPRDYQAGPEHMACSKMATVGSHPLMRAGGVSNSSSSGGYHATSLSSDKSSVAAAALFAGKYRQHQRASHRLHPYMMTSSMGGSFAPLMTPAFSQMQQVSCYNV